MVPEEVAAELGDFFREKSAPAVAAFAGDLVDALFQGIPESANSKEVPAKTKVRRGSCVITMFMPACWTLPICFVHIALAKHQHVRPVLDCACL